MKKVLMALLCFSLIGVSPKANASFLNSDWFEPSLFCLAGGAAGYLGANDGDEVTQGAIFCAVAGGLAYFINQRYKAKYGAKYQEEIRDLRRDIHEMQIMQAQKFSKGEEDEEFSIKIREFVPGKRLEDGSVLAPTFREKLVAPGEGNMIGE